MADRTGRSSSWEARVLVAILLAALGLRLFHLGAACYWLDEFYSLENSTGRGMAHMALPVNRVLGAHPDLTSLEGAPPWYRVWSSLDYDSQPPLYFLALRAWRAVAPRSEFGTRLLSTVLSLAAVAAVYAALRPRTSAAGALWATAIMAVAAGQVHYAQETRGYAQWQFLAAVAVLVLARIEERGATPGRLVALFLATLALPLTHYFAAASALALGVYALLAFRGRLRVRVLLTLVAAGVGYAAAWGVFFYRQRAHFGPNSDWQIDTSAHPLLMTLQRIGLLPLRWLSESAASVMPAGAVPFAAIAIAAATVALFAVAWQRRGAQLIFILQGGLLVAAVAVVDLVHHGRSLDIIRYTFVATPALAAAAGAVVARFGARWAHVIPAALFVLCLVTIRGAYSTAQDWRTAALWLAQNVRAGDTVVYATGGREDWWAGSLYLGINHYAPELPGAAVLLTARGADAAALGPILYHSDRPTWLLGARDEDPARTLPGCRPIESVWMTFARVSEVLPPAATPVNSQSR